MSEGNRSRDDLLGQMAELRRQVEELKAASSERELAEERALLDQSDWVTTFNSMSDWVSVVDLERRILRSNAAVRTFVGVAEDEAVGRVCCELVHGGKAPLPGCPLARMLRSHSRETEEIALPDSGRWLSVSVEPIKDEGGSVVRAVHVVRDITDRERAREALLESQRQHTRDLEYLSRTALEFVALPPSADIYEHIARRLKEIAGGAIVLVNSFDVDSGLLECRSVLGLGKLSRSVLKLIGRDPVGMRFPVSEEAREGLSKGEPVKVPEGLYVLALGQIPEAACKAIEKLLGIADIYATGIAREGELLGSAVLMTRTRAELKNRTVVQTFVSQASTALQHRRAEEGLRKSEEKLRVLFEGTHDLVTLTDADARPLWANPAWRRVFGEDLTGREDPFRLIHPDDVDQVAQTWGRLVANQEAISNLNYRFRGDDGEYRVFESSAYPVSIGGKRFYYVVARDTTDRKRAEDALRSSQERLRAFMDSATESFGIFDSELNLLDINEVGVSMLPAGTRKEDLIGKNLVELVPVLEETGRCDMFMSVIKTGNPYYAVDIVPHPTFGDRHLELRAFKVGEGLGIIATDVTDRSRAEKEIARLAKFPSEDPNPVLRVSKDGRVTYSNEASSCLLENWGCRRGQTLPDRWHGPVLEALGSGETQRAETACGGLIFTLTFAPVVESDYVNIYALDITDRKRAEETLTRKLLELHSFLDNIPDMAWLKDKDSNFIAANKAFGDAVGFDPAYLVNHTCAVCFGEEAAAKFKEDDANVMESGQQVRIEESITNARGETVSLETIKSPIFDEQGEVVGTVGIARNISARKRAEEELDANRVKLRSLASELVLAEERERRHIATWLHDSISQALALSRMKVRELREEMTSTKAAGALEDIGRALDLAIQEAESMTFDLGSPILYEIGLEAAVERLTEEFQAKSGILCSFEDDGQPKPLDGEARVVLYRAVRELLVNIVKHAQATSAEVGMQRVGDTIRINVADNGTGFDASPNGLHGSKSERFGLFSIRERLGHFGGELRVESGQASPKGQAERCGTRVTLVVPLTHDQTDEAGG